MTTPQEPDPRRFNTIAMLGQAYSLLGFRIVDGVVGAGHPIRPNHSAVFAQIKPGGSRLTELAVGARRTPQSMGEIVDELESPPSTPASPPSWASRRTSCECWAPRASSGSARC